MKFLEKILSSETHKKLNELLGAELTASINEKLTDFEIDVAKEKFLPKSRYDEAVAESRTLKESLEQVEAKVQELTSATTDAESLKTQIENLNNQLKTQSQEYDEKLLETKRNHLFREQLHNYKPKNIKALEALIDKSKISYDDNGIVGLEEQIKDLQQNESYLFSTPSGTGMPNEASALTKGETVQAKTHVI